MENRQDTTLQEQQQAQEQQQGGNVGEEHQKRKRMQLPPAEERPEHEVTLTESQKEYYRKKLEPVNAKYDGYGDQNTKDLVVDFANSLLKALGQKTRLGVDSGNLVIKEITFRPCRQENSYTDPTVLATLRGRTRSSRRRRVPVSREERGAPVSREERGADDAENSVHEAENNAIAGSPNGANETMGGSMDERFELIGGGTIPQSSHNMEMMEPQQSQFGGFEPIGGSTGQESNHQQEQVEGFEPTGGTIGLENSHRQPQVEGLEPTRDTMGLESSHDREVESPVEGFQPIGGSTSADVEVGQHNTSPGGVQLRNIRSKLDPQVIAALKEPTNTRPNKEKSHSDVRVQTMQEVGRDTDETIRQGHSSTSPLGVDMRTSISRGDCPVGSSRGMDQGGENPESPNTRLSRLANSLREKEMLLKELIQDVLVDTDRNSIYGRLLLESLVSQFVLLEFPTPSCPVSVSELAKKVVCGIKTSLGVAQTKLSHVNFNEEIRSIVATFHGQYKNDRIYLPSDEAAPNAEALRQVEKLRLEIDALKRERDSIQAEQGQIPRQ